MWSLKQIEYSHRRQKYTKAIENTVKKKVTVTSRKKKEKSLPINSSKELVQISN